MAIFTGLNLNAPQRFCDLYTLISADHNRAALSVEAESENEKLFGANPKENAEMRMEWTKG